MAIAEQRDYSVDQRELNLGVAAPGLLLADVATKRNPIKQTKSDKMSVVDSLAEHLGNLSRMIANITESYSTCVFVSDPSASYLTLVASHTLSRDVIPHAKVPFGSGLVGWAAQNKSRIIVAPFEQSSTSLIYYSTEQQLKSFIAVPILAEDKSLLGILCCDSKKNYAFAKVTEKILEDCANQAAFIITSIFRGVKRGAPTHSSSNSSLAAQYELEVKSFIASLDDCRTESELFARVLKLPHEIAPRDALVVVTAADSIGGEPRTLSAPGNNLARAHRLLELVCRHRPVICPDRPVQVENKEGGAGCTFLSVPFKVLHTEAGSINLLSQPGLPFSGQHTAALEHICRAVGRQVEALRLKARVAKPDELDGVLTWENFRARAAAAFSGSRSSRSALTIWRLDLSDTSELEALFDLTLVDNVRTKVLRALVQSVSSCGFVGVAAGNQALVVCESKKLERSRLCFHKLMEQYCIDDNRRDNINGRSLSLNGKVTSKPLHSLVLAGIRENIVSPPKDGDSFEELLSHSFINDKSPRK